MGSEQLPKHTLLSLLNCYNHESLCESDGYKRPLSTKHTEFYLKFYRILGALEVSNELQIKKT